MSAAATLGQLLAEHAGARPDDEAVVFEDRNTSYAALDAEADAVAAALLDGGFITGDRVGYLGRNSDRLLVLLLGCARAGLVLTPVNWRLAPEEVGYVLGHSESRIVFVTREHAGLETQLRVVDVDAHWKRWLEPFAGRRPEVAVGANDALLQIYSSGTTGRPKGVELTHASVLGGARGCLTDTLGRWTAADRVLIALPLFHVSALLMASYALMAGGTAIILRDADVGGLVGAARAQRVTRAGFVPTLMQLVIDSPAFDPDAFRALELIVYGGSSITPALLERVRAAFGCGFLQLYGMSETFTIGTALTPADHEKGDPVLLASCGRALPGVGVRIVGADGRDVPAGLPGEVLLRTPSMMNGYWRAPEATAEVLVDGWYRTGDGGVLDATGLLTLRDRLKDMVISGGENVYPAEVEAALAGHPGVSEVAVIGVPDPRWGEAVAAYVVLRAGATTDEDALIEHARGRIARYKCPRSVTFVDSLPKNAAGKVLKRLLRDRQAEPSA